MTGRNAQFTGSIPAAYDRFLGPMLFEPYADDLTARLTVPPTAAVLELACGTGILTGRLRHALPATATLTATDLNEPMLAYARAKVPDAGITWQTADAQALPFPDAAFDAVACQFGLMFVPDKTRAFGEVRRALRAHGQFAFNVWLSLAENPLGRIARDTIARYFTSDPPTFYEVPFSFHDEAYIRDLLRAAHFGVVSCEPVVLEARSPSAHDAARGLVTGNPILLDVGERATAPPEEIIHAVAAALAAQGGDAPLRLPMRALVFLARAV
jgi:ubiquinone/menaquinone biosynthesis C-methylase UbiE